MLPQLFHTVNSGLYIRLDNSVIFIDGLHTGRRFGLSDTPEEILTQLGSYSGIFRFDTLLLFTHCHDDHYDDELTAQFMAHHPGTRLVLPEESRGVEIERQEDGTYRFEHGPFTVHAFSSTHQGGQIMQTAHLCYLISAGEKSWLHCGDARLSEDLVMKIKKYAGDGLEAVFLNVYHLNTEKEQRLIRMLSPRRCLISHLPLPEEDVKGYCAMAREALRTVSGVGQLEMLSAMSGI